MKGKNPLADLRVRRAIGLAINRDAIQRVVMRGQSTPIGSIGTPFINGYPKEFDSLPSFDVAAARKLLTEAGYPNGFSLTFHTTNDRYVNDEAVAQAVVGMLGQIGIKATLVSQSLRVHFPGIQRGEYDFYLLGWGIPTFDSHYVFNDLYRTKTASAGTWNGTGYSNAALDAEDRRAEFRGRPGEAQRRHRRDLETGAGGRGLCADPHAVHRRRDALRVEHSDRRGEHPEDAFRARAGLLSAPPRCILATCPTLKTGAAPAARSLRAGPAFLAEAHA